MLEPREELLLKQDREDLLALLEIRFGDVPPHVVEKVNRTDQPHTLERLILAAANAASWQVFIEELEAEDGSFKMVGERFSPL